MNNPNTLQNYNVTVWLPVMAGSPCSGRADTHITAEAGACVCCGGLWRRNGVKREFEAGVGEGVQLDGY